MLSTQGVVTEEGIIIFGPIENGKVGSFVIPVEDLLKIENYRGNSFSYAVNKLSIHPWVEMETLLFLARKIDKYLNELKIDWFAQFVELESKMYENKMMQQYLESLGIKKEPRHVSEPDFQLWWINYSIFCANTQKKDPNEIIQDRVRNNLAKNNLM